MDFSPFKLDIDELISDFSESNSTSLADMKRIWLSRKFSFIYEAKPTKNVACFIQTLFAHSIGHMISTSSLSQRLGGLYCLYCLYVTQPFKPPFKVYLSLGELKSLKDLVVTAKKENLGVVPALVKRMLDSQMFLYGSLEMNDRSITERLKEISNLQNASIKIAYEKLLANTRIDHFLKLDLGKELGLEEMKKMSTEYCTTKEIGINEASKVVDIQNIKHIAENRQSCVNAVEKVVQDWNTQKELFHQQTRLNEQQGSELVCFQPDEEEEEEEDDEFTKELDDLLV